MDSWERFDEKALPDKKDFYSCLNMENVTDIDYRVRITEKGVRWGVCQVSHGYAKANNKYMKNYDESKESSFLEYQGSNNL